MSLHEREVTLKLKSRPLRLVYLIRNRDELVDAVTLYTHIWGGAANTIFPVPENEEEAHTLRFALKSINPDYILVPREVIPSYVSQVLKQSTGLLRPISSPEVQRHIQGSRSDFLRLRDGTVSHIGLILQHLYSSGLNNSKPYLVDYDRTFNLEIALQCGIPTQFHRDYLVQHLAADVFHCPQTIEQLIKVSLLFSRFDNPKFLTLIKTQRSLGQSSPPWIEDEETLGLFLDDGHDIGIPTSFWNYQWFIRQNKIFLPRDAFLTNLKHHASLIVEFMPSIRALFVKTPLNHQDASDLCSNLKNVFATVGKDILVKVNYQGFRFDWLQGSRTYGGTINCTRLINYDSSVRFDPPVPFGHDNTNCLFGYDAEVKFVSGKKFSLPATQVTSQLLTNELLQIERAENNQDDWGEAWLRLNLPVRAETKGVTGTALAGKECRFFVHPDDVVISRHLKQAGFEVKPNKHTRYVQGCIKRFGGFDKVISLIDKQGADILSALVTHRAEQGGLYRDKIKSFLTKERGLSQQDADQISKQKLPLLLENGLVRRGYSLCCPTCNLTDWYSLEEVREFIECRGCAEKFQFPLEGRGLQFTYTANELAARLVKEGGIAVIKTAEIFRQIDYSGLIQFGGELLHPGDKENFAEVDLFWLTDEAFIIAECKSYHKIEQKDIVEIKDSLAKTVEVAAQIDVQVVILGVVTNSSELSDLFSVVADAAQNDQNRGIGVHLALNGKLHLWGSPDGTEAGKVQLGQLLGYNTILAEGESVGELPQTYHFGISRATDNTDVLHRWEQELSLTKTKEQDNKTHPGFTSEDVEASSSVSA